MALEAPGSLEEFAINLANRSPEIADTVNANTPFLKLLQAGKGKEPFKGGRVISEEINYVAYNQAQWIEGASTFATVQPPVVTTANYPIRQAVAVAIMTGRDIAQNRGIYAAVDLMETRLATAIASLANAINEAIMGEPTTALQINGLQTLVADDPTAGVIGGISAAEWPFWQNQSFSCTTDGGAPFSSANCYTYMQNMKSKLTRGSDKPDAWPASSAFFNIYSQSLTPIARVGLPEGSDKGYGFASSLMFDGAVVLDCGGYQGSAQGFPTAEPVGRMYALNTKYLHYRPDIEYDFKPLNKTRSWNQDAFIIPVEWMGNVTTSFRALQGVITN